MADNSSNAEKVESSRPPNANGAEQHDAVEAETRASGKEKEKKKKKKNKMKLSGGLDAIMAKLGIAPPVLAVMLKGSLPPVIGIAIYQSTAVSSQFTTLGYLVSIISILGMAVLPRGKFIQSMILNVLSICLGAAVCMLALWSAIQARIHTTPAGESVIDPATGSTRYNASQSAVCGVWLFALIWVVNVFRSKFPTFNVPAVLFSIFVNVSTTFGVRMPSVAYAGAFVKQLITSMLAGLAITTLVSLLVFPVSSRGVVTNEFKGTVGLLRKIVGLQTKYLASLEELDMFTVATNVARDEAEEEADAKGKKEKRNKKNAPTKELQAAAAQARELMGKIQVDIVFAKREVAWGKLDAKDMSEINKLVRNAAIPITGMTSIMDIFQRVAERRGWNHAADPSPEVLVQKNTEKTVWNEVMKRMHEPFQILSEAIDGGLEHAALQLEILPRPKAAKKKAEEGVDVDVEAGGDALEPGDAGFTEVIDEKLERFRCLKGVALRAWTKERALVRAEQESELSSEELRERDQAQLYVLLYMERLMYGSAKGMRDLVAFSDQKVQDGTMSKSRLIFPSQRRLRKWMMSIFGKGDSSAQDSHDSMEAGGNAIHVGDGYNRKRNPEHLPPTNAWERFGNGLRKISAFFGSGEASFGLRVSCATMTVGIVAFLESSQAFFIEQRLVWAMIIIALGMTITSGQSIFSLLCRVGGTVISMICSYIIWYIVDEKTAGVIVFLWVSLFCDFYFFVKFPRFIPAVMITMVTQAMIIGYELQVRKIGVAAAAASGQPYYPTYQLAPYRVATVAGGSFVAFIWTIFPSPLTDRTWLRRDLSATLYLMANYFSVINSTVKAQIQGTGGDPDVVGTPAHHLQKIRRKILGKVMLLLPSMQQHADWQKWEPTIGGKFPRATYEDIIKRSQRIVSYLTFMSYTATHQPVGTSVNNSTANSSRKDLAVPLHDGQQSKYPSSEQPAADTDRVWLNALSIVLREISPTHHNIVSTLTLLSNSLYSGQSLPPCLALPRPYEMTRALLRLDKHHHVDNDNNSTDEDTDLPPLMMINSGTGKVLDDDRQEASLGLGGQHILDVANMEQPGYAEFAVLEICNTLVCNDIEGLVKDVAALVGVVDFSYAVDGSTGGDEGRGKVD